MPITLDWQDVALRLVLTFVTGAVIGIDRGEHRRAVGLRTTLLLSLAACVAMLQANLLMNSVGKASDSFVVLDLMRLPLGILSGIGFIGAGAILKRGDVVLGVTTAATMWFVTVMGLCFGGGQLGLGLAAFALALLILTVMKWMEDALPQQQSAALRATFADDSFDEVEFRAALEGDGRKIASWGISYMSPARVRKVQCELRWHSRQRTKETPRFVEQWAHRHGIEELEWKSK